MRFEAELGSDVCDPRVVLRATHGATGVVDHLLNVQEARHLLRVSQNTLYRHAAAGRIPGALKIGGKWRFQRAILLEWLACKASR